MVVRQGMELSVVGILAGLAGAAAVTCVMASTLFRVSALDAAIFVAVLEFSPRWRSLPLQSLRCAPPGWILSSHCEKNSPPEPPMLLAKQP
jgi:hypothetical protein